MTRTVAIDPIEAVRLRAKMRHHKNVCSMAIGQNRLTHTPSAVAMPFPPRNEENKGKRCPIIAASAHNDCSVLGSCKMEQGKSAKMPLPTSPARVASAPLREPIRSTLVVPGFPEPCFRGSGIFNA